MILFLPLYRLSQGKYMSLETPSRISNLWYPKSYLETRALLKQEDKLSMPYFSKAKKDSGDFDLDSSYRLPRF